MLRRVVGATGRSRAAAGGASALGPFGDFARLGAAIPQGIAAGVGTVGVSASGSVAVLTVHTTATVAASAHINS